jgi:hypothetical protein
LQAGEPYLPRPDDNSDGPSTLPTPELNPLLNPVLGQNMGRWAEVYFTSPPEKREQAVLELLRELRAENPELESASGASAPAILEPDSPMADPYPQIAPVEQASVRCGACARENPASHRFCGMCGRLMAEPITEPIAEPVATHGATSDHEMAESKVSDLHVSDLHVSDLHVSDRHVSDLHLDHLPLEPPAFTHSPVMRSDESHFVPEEAVYEPTLSTNEPRIFRNAGENAYRDDYKGGMFESEPEPRRYRVYVGIALAVVIFALAYIAWRSTQATSQSAHVAPQAPPAVTTPPAAPAPTESLSTNETAVGASDPSDRPAATAPPEAASIRTSTSTVRRKPAPAEPPASSAAEAGAANGTEELAMAQRYLEGIDGQEPNRAEAAKWLWKAMGKHNSRATLLLADLYLKGEGVSKNCDQARVLLDSATREGMKEAGERLRHLQAFGCQ